jgi:hypothetical protein
MSNRKDQKTLRILEAQKAARAKELSPKHKTKPIDLTKVRTVRIDEKTIVYAALDEDPEEVRARYLKVMKKNSALKPIDKYHKKKEKDTNPETENI